MHGAPTLPWVLLLLPGLTIVLGWANRTGLLRSYCVINSIDTEEGDVEAVASMGPI
jgi:hypothetical protein